MKHQSKAAAIFTLSVFLARNWYVPPNFGADSPSFEPLVVFYHAAINSAEQISLSITASALAWGR